MGVDDIEDSLDFVGGVIFRGWDRGYRLPKQILESSVGGKRGRGRPRRRWEDSVGNDLDVRELRWEVARELARDRGRWRRVVKGGVDGRTPNTA